MPIVLALRWLSKSKMEETLATVLLLDAEVGEDRFSAVWAGLIVFPQNGMCKKTQPKWAR
jgi:hypothetical protein